MAFFVVSSNDIVSLSGEDRRSFLSGLITNQIHRLDDQTTLYAALLTPQGRFLWDFSIVQMQSGEEIVLCTESGRVEALIQRLQIYQLRARVVLENQTSLMTVIRIAGDGADEAVVKIFPEAAGLPRQPGVSCLLDRNRSRIWRDPRHADFGWSLLIPVDQQARYQEILAQEATSVDSRYWENHRIRLGLPRGGVDMIPESTLALEAGLLDLNGVDFQKGCYVGQETTARTHYRGTLKKRLYQIQIQLQEGSECLDALDAIRLPAPLLTDPDKEVGRLTSFVRSGESFAGLALIRVSDVLSEKPITLNGYPVSVKKPSWASW